MLWLGKSIFLTQWFYILSVFNMERYLACPTSLAVFINQDNQYQQNKQEKNIMIKCKWDVKEYFQRYNTNEKHKTILSFFFSKVIYLLRQNLSKFASLSGYLRTTKIYSSFGSGLLKLPIFSNPVFPCLRVYNTKRVIRCQCRDFIITFALLL